jgi:hypothetical protein
MSRFAIGMVLFGALAAGCDATENGPDPYPALPVPDSGNVQPTDVLQVPAGSVPSILVGGWTGGPGDKTGHYLQIASDGSYQRGRTGSAPDEAGVIVANGEYMALFTSAGGRQDARWGYAESGGIEVLAITYAHEGYFSYVRT